MSPEGIHTFATQTHPADGCAGAVVTSTARARLNVRGGSLVLGHPQGPTGMRSIAELVEVSLRGGGVGLFTGCAAGGGWRSPSE